MYKMDIRQAVIHENYRKYRLYLDNIGIGYIVLERYNDVWDLELMEICQSERNRGYGTHFLTQVLALEHLEPKNMTICPISDDSRRFFKRCGFLC
jgi:hypothetical protein